VRYAGSRKLVVRLVWARGRLRVEVEDDGSGAVHTKPADSTRGGGYGLRLVQALADDWGWRDTESGKSVWFELVVGEVGEPGVGGGAHADAVGGAGVTPDIQFSASGLAPPRLPVDP